MYSRLTSKYLNLINRQRLSGDAVRLDDRHRMAVDRKNVVRIARKSEESHAIFLASSDIDDRQRLRSVNRAVVIPSTASIDQRRVGNPTGGEKDGSCAGSTV